MLQKLEADVRQHIRVEQQLKLHIESIQEKMEEDEKVIAQFEDQKDRFHRERARMDEMLTIRETEIKRLEEKLKAVSEQVTCKDLKISELVKNLEEATKTLEQERVVFNTERKMMVRFNKSSEDGKIYSKSNERRDQSEGSNGKSFSVTLFLTKSNLLPRGNLSKIDISTLIFKFPDFDLSYCNYLPDV